MSNVHPTGHFCHSSTVVDFECYILRAIFLRGPPHVSWGFIGVSLPRATIRRGEVGAWRPVLSHCIAGPNPRPPGSCWKPPSVLQARRRLTASKTNPAAVG